LFKKLPLGKFQTNCYIIADDASKEAAVIDPADDFQEIKQFIEKHNLKVKYILLTHAHGDHILALPELKAFSMAPIGINIGDEDMLSDCNINMSGQFTKVPIEAKADFYLKDGDILELGNTKVSIIHTPGHTKGGASILFEKELMSGDTLFLMGIGRTDLYGGDYNTLINSIKTKLFILPEDIKVHPGHGSSTTILNEKNNNPFN
jgi:glyoxylase-like metal-dependent hydrolase (beta-lactamase superfamily II)